MKSTLKPIQSPEKNGKNWSKMGDAKEIWCEMVFFGSLSCKTIRGNW